MPLPSVTTFAPVSLPAISRNATIVASVVLFHALALWALQTGLLHRMVEIVVPAEILVEIMAPPAAPTPPTPSIVPPRPAPTRQPRPPVERPTPPAPVVVQPQPLAVAPSVTAEQPSAIAPAATTATAAAPVVSATPAQAPAPTARVELPSSNADYLNNPKPNYPPLSKRLDEQGKVVVRTLIGADGIAQKAEIKQSSGFDRLDRVALETALRWRYVPGKRAGVPEAMWFNVPFNFVLE